MVRLSVVEAEGGSGLVRALLDSSIAVDCGNYETAGEYMGWICSKNRSRGLLLQHW